MDHKFYADERTATLVELRYYLQALSMTNAPPIADADRLKTWEWITEGPIGVGLYLDPVQLIPIDFKEFFETPRIVTSGHLVPLDRQGRHEPHTTFLTLKISNDIQGNLTSDELLTFMHDTVAAHQEQRGWDRVRDGAIRGRLDLRKAIRQHRAASLSARGAHSR